MLELLVVVFSVHLLLQIHRLLHGLHTHWLAHHWLHADRLAHHWLHTHRLKAHRLAHHWLYTHRLADHWLYTHRLAHNWLYDCLITCHWLIAHAFIVSAVACVAVFGSVMLVVTIAFSLFIRDPFFFKLLHLRFCSVLFHCSMDLR